MKSSSIGSSQNLTLSDDGVEDGEVDELINWIIRELDPIAITVKNDEVDSGVVDQTENCLKSSQRYSQGLFHHQTDGIH